MFLALTPEMIRDRQMNLLQSELEFQTQLEENLQNSVAQTIITENDQVDNNVNVAVEVRTEEEKNAQSERSQAQVEVGSYKEIEYMDLIEIKKWYFTKKFGLAYLESIDREGNASILNENGCEIVNVLELERALDVNVNVHSSEGSFNFKFRADGNYQAKNFFDNILRAKLTQNFNYATSEVFLGGNLVRIVDSLDTKYDSTEEIERLENIYQEKFEDYQKKKKIFDDELIKTILVKANEFKEKHSDQIKDLDKKISSNDVPEEKTPEMAVEKIADQVEEIKVIPIEEKIIVSETKVQEIRQQTHNVMLVSLEETTLTTETQEIRTITEIENEEIHDEIDDIFNNEITQVEAKDEPYDILKQFEDFKYLIDENGITLLEMIQSMKNDSVFSELKPTLPKYHLIADYLKAPKYEEKSDQGILNVFYDSNLNQLLKISPNQVTPSIDFDVVINSLQKLNTCQIFERIVYTKQSCPKGSFSPSNPIILHGFSMYGPFTNSHFPSFFNYNVKIHNTKNDEVQLVRCSVFDQKERYYKFFLNTPMYVDSGDFVDLISTENDKDLNKDQQGLSKKLVDSTNWTLESYKDYRVKSQEFNKKMEAQSGDGGVYVVSSDNMYFYGNDGVRFCIANHYYHSITSLYYEKVE